MNDPVFTAMRGVQDVMSDYLPPDGINGQEAINRILEITDDRHLVRYMRQVEEARPLPGTPGEIAYENTRLRNMLQICADAFRRMELDAPKKDQADVFKLFREACDVTLKPERKKFGRKPAQAMRETSRAEATVAEFAKPKTNALAVALEAVHPSRTHYTNCPARRGKKCDCGSTL